ncbi:MAG: Phosphotransferase enzyme [Caeruleum heppii]|nr:MAG: Phosphotransferase enzyme [Caeruleum heppii]
MDDGIEVIAKLPNPNAGPKYLTTASEVATRHFLREILELPIPRIYASSFDPSNAVGAEYIIEEKARGQPLGGLWYQWPIESQLDMVSQVVELEKKLGSISFPKHGCIYYKADLDRRGIAANTLPPELLTTENITKPLDPSTLGKYAIGPLTDAKLWEGERAEMDMDRGPWSNALEYVKALGGNEIRYVESCAQPRMNFHRSMESPELPDDFLSLLSRYMTLAPYLVPTTSEDLHVKTLSHPDLHLDNIFVDPDTRRITNIIDWQSTSVCEVFLQRRIPPMLSVAGFDRADEVSDDELDDQDTNQGEKHNTELVSHYKGLTRIRNPRRWTVLRNDDLPVLTKPVSLVCGAWDREDVFSFRHALITIIAHWESIAPESTPCPINFTDLELELHGAEMELMENLGTIMHQLQDENLIPLGGMVRPEYYEQAQKINQHFKGIFVSLAENEQQKILHATVWPYRDDQDG